MKEEKQADLVYVRGMEPFPRKELLSDFLGILDPICMSIKDLLSQARAHVALTYFKIGQKIEDALMRADAKSSPDTARRYRSEILAYFACEVGVSTRVMHDCHKVATCFAPAEYEKLVKRDGFQWGHVRLLAAIAGAKRDAMILKIKQEHLTVEQFENEIVGIRHQSPRGPGRSPAVPRNINDAARRFLSLSTRLSNTTDAVLFGERFDILAAIGDAPPDTLTERSRDLLRECHDQAKHLGEMSRRVCGRLEKAIARVEEAIEAQAKWEREHQEVESEIIPMSKMSV